jgi:hypothetical protein
MMLSKSGAKEKGYGYHETVNKREVLIGTEGMGMGVVWGYWVYRELVVLMAEED